MAPSFSESVVRAVPVHDLGALSYVGNVDSDRYALAEAQQGTGDLAVVGDGLDVDAGRYLDGAGFYGQGMVGGGQRRFGTSRSCGSLLRMEKAGRRRQQRV